MILACPLQLYQLKGMIDFSSRFSWFQFIPEVADGFFHTKLIHLYGPYFVHWCSVVIEQKEVIPEIPFK